MLGRGPVVQVRGAVARPRVRAAAGRHRVLRLGRGRRRRSRGHRGVLRRLDRPHHRGQHERLLREEELPRRQRVDTRVRDAAVPVITNHMLALVPFAINRCYYYPNRRQTDT